MTIHPEKGRPFGGRVFIVKDRLNVLKHEFINQYLATITFNDNNKLFTLIACYLPYDNGSFLNFSEFQSCLQVAYELLLFFEKLNHSVFIIGDLNSDLLRNKRFDILLNNYLKNNDLLVISPSYDINNFSYIKGDYTARLDHCFRSNKHQTSEFVNSSYIDDVINLSDHKPLLITIEWKSKLNCFSQNILQTLNCDKIVKLPPNFNNFEIKDKFNSILKINMHKFVNRPIENNENKQFIIDSMYSQLTSSIKLAYDACSRTISVNNIKKNKNWFTNELKALRNKMLIIRHKKDKSSEDIIVLKSLKKDFKKMMKKNIFLYEKNEFFKIGSFIKANSGKNFFKSVNLFLNNNKTPNLDINAVLSHYDSIFNDPIHVDTNTFNQINEGIADIIHDNFQAIEISIIELNMAIKNTQVSNVVGDDGLTSNMILNLNPDFISNILLFFFRFIFRYGVIPINFNNTHIIPIIKDKTKSINDLSNLRPISISNTLAQIFERIIKSKTPELDNTHQNQFGYKHQTSCTHALFVFKETIIKHLEEKKHLFAISLDAVKAFDRLWRNALFYKLKNKIQMKSIVIIIKIYYDNLQAKIKINNVLSKVSNLTEV